MLFDRPGYFDRNNLFVWGAVRDGQNCNERSGIFLSFDSNDDHGRAVFTPFFLPGLMFAVP